MIFGAILAAIGSGAAAAGSAVGTAAGALGSAAGAAAQGIGTAAGAIGKGVGVAAKGVGQAVGQAGQGLGELGKGVVEGVQGIGKGVQGGMKGLEKLGNMNLGGKIGDKIGSIGGDKGPVGALKKLGKNPNFKDAKGLLKSAMGKGESKPMFEQPVSSGELSKPNQVVNLLGQQRDERKQRELLHRQRMNGLFGLGGYQ